MCRELNAIGLPDPVFDNNTFILKTTICSAAYEKLPIGQTKVTDFVGNFLEQIIQKSSLQNRRKIC